MSLSKQQRLPFFKSSITTNDVFELIHVDLWGPYSVQSISGASYVLTMVDNFSKTTWTFLLKEKINVSNILK